MVGKLLGLLLCVGTLAGAQEVRHIVVVGNQEDYSNWRQAYRYSICGTDQRANSRKAIRASIESIVPAVIQPKKDIYVVLKIENTGSLPVTLPIGSELIQAEEGATHYRASFDVLAGVPAGATRLGSLELYGSSSRLDSLITLHPGESMRVEGELRPHNWFADSTEATAHADLQLYIRDPSRSLVVDCVKQDSGTTFPVFYPGVENEH